MSRFPSPAGRGARGERQHQVGTSKRADLVLLVNGFPLVVIEAKTPVRASQSWLDGALQIHEDYERNVPELFVPNLLSVATEGKELRYGSIGLPLDLWGPWYAAGTPRTHPHPVPLPGGEGGRDLDAARFIREGGSDDSDSPRPLGEGMGVRVARDLNKVSEGVAALLRPNVLLDILANFTCYATDKSKRRIKIVARYQQYDGANKIVERVVAGQPKKGLIWHFQG